MPEMNDIVKLAVDAYHGNVEQYSVGQSQEVLWQALVEANGGSTVGDRAEPDRRRGPAG